MEDELMTLGAAAKQRKIPSKRTLNRWAQQGKIEVIRLPSGRYLIWRSVLDRIFEPAVGGGDHATTK
jgi:predicted site-specific integrase-resolvase